MGRVIVKISPDADRYVEWSTVTDTPSAAFTREAWLAAHPDEGARLDRADRNGISALDPFAYGWGDDEFLVQDLYGGRFVTVPRRDLPAVGLAISRGEHLHPRWPMSSDEEGQP